MVALVGACGSGGSRTQAAGKWKNCQVESELATDCRRRRDRDAGLCPCRCLGRPFFLRPGGARYEPNSTCQDAAGGRHDALARHVPCTLTKNPSPVVSSTLAISRSIDGALVDSTHPLWALCPPPKKQQRTRRWRIPPPDVEPKQTSSSHEQQHRTGTGTSS